MNEEQQIQFDELRGSLALEQPPSDEERLGLEVTGLSGEVREQDEVIEILQRRLAEQQAWIKSVTDEVLFPLSHFPAVGLNLDKLAKLADGFGQIQVSMDCTELNTIIAKEVKTASAESAREFCKKVLSICNKEIEEPNEGMSDFADGYDAACKEIARQVSALRVEEV